MTIPEILVELTAPCNGEFPYEALEAAIAQRDAVIPELLQLLEQDTANLSDIAYRSQDGIYLGLRYALYLLAQFREPRAYPLLINLLSADQVLLLVALREEFFSESMDRMLASVCNGDTGPIEALIENTSLAGYTRESAMGALVVLVAQREKSRDEVMGFLATFFQGKLPRTREDLWSALVDVCRELYPGEVMAEIKQAYADNLISDLYVMLDEVQEAFDAGKEETLALLATVPKRRFITDTIGEMQHWLIFIGGPVEGDQSFDDDDMSWVDEEAGTGHFWVTPLPHAEEQEAVVVEQQPARRALPKVGRNEMCPCGSGKKYKRCCG